MTVSAALARTLAAARPDFNARVAAARHARPGFDEAAFYSVLRDGLDPIAVAIETVAPERLGAVVDAAYDIALMLVAQGLAGPGSRQDAVNRLWAEVLPPLARAVAEQPFDTIATLSNAAVNIAATPGARVGEWLERMASLGDHLDSQTREGIGVLAAWRAGMVHYRASALAAAETLPEAAVLAALGLDGDWSQVRASLDASPWWPGDPGIAELGVEFGAFAGFGGPFSEPPQLRACPEGFLVRSGDRFGLLIAGAWGATLHPASPDCFAGAEAEGARIDGTSVQAGDRVIVADLPAERLQAVANQDSLAIASPFSHVIRIYPWRCP